MKSEGSFDPSDKPIVNAVEYLLRYAYDQRSSDVHIEPKRDYSLVRFRIDGVLHPVQRMPKVVHSAVISRIGAIEYVTKPSMKYFILRQNVQRERPTSRRRRV